MLTLQMIQLMDVLWKQEGLDLRWAGGTQGCWGCFPCRLLLPQQLCLSSGRVLGARTAEQEGRRQGRQGKQPRVGRISVEGFLSSLQDDPLWLPLHRRQDGADRGGHALGHHRQHPAQQEQHGGHGRLQQGRPAQLAQVQEPGVRGSVLLSLPCCVPCSSAQLQAVLPCLAQLTAPGHTPHSHSSAAQVGEAGVGVLPQTALQKSRADSLPLLLLQLKTALPWGTTGGCSKILFHSCCPV